MLLLVVDEFVCRDVDVDELLPLALVHVQRALVEEYDGVRADENVEQPSREDGAARCSSSRPELCIPLNEASGSRRV